MKVRSGSDRAHRQTEDHYLIALEEETTMTEKREIDFENSTTDAADTSGWSQLTFTCPECGSNKLLKCLGDVRGQADHAEVVEIHYKRGEWEDADEDDVEDTEVLVQFGPDLIETWDLSGDEETFFHFWFRCAECDYKLVYEDGTWPADDEELVHWIIRSGKTCLEWIKSLKDGADQNEDEDCESEE